ncbi:hypothetical protein Taro_031288 [Colocasia esculenta]|uniref:non-specific serine/threonine protein kinase n=1 Tax=Colocasia esculenta TaxID=4460 RepID=A0A843W0F2_COLES|nr:hypothetical protein [Colocasia esculenta]
METPLVPSGSSCSEVSSICSERTAEMTPESVGNFDNSLASSFDALRITDSACSKTEDLGVPEDLEGVKRGSWAAHKASLAGECQSAFSQLLMICRQTAPVTLAEVIDPGSLVKIGEGTYGEAFKAGTTVCKIVPIDGDLLVNGEVQKRSEEVLEEVLLSLTLNDLRGDDSDKEVQNACSIFIETKDFHICQGAYGADLINAWEVWDAKNGSENDHPKEFSDNQCYIVFSLADGGRDLESFVLLNFDESRSLLVQVTAALAVAEIACEFEHRDLHWGNILLTRKEASIMEFTIEGRKMSIKTCGLTVAIIDFTLSRINTGDAILFLDLSADPGLFEGPKGDRQSETYRKMKEVTEECWEGSFPKTNVLWLQYLVDILLLKKSFKRTAKDERDLRSLKKRLNSRDSAKDALSDTFFSDLLIEAAS